MRLGDLQGAGISWQAPDGHYLGTDAGFVGDLDRDGFDDFIVSGTPAWGSRSTSFGAVAILSRTTVAGLSTSGSLFKLGVWWDR